MKTNFENNVLTIYLEGRVDSANASAVEAELLEEVNGNPGAALILDADGLEYISSAGLRVLMKLRKQTGKSLPVVNVSPEVYDILEVTGFDCPEECLRVARDETVILSEYGVDIVGANHFEVVDGPIALEVEVLVIGE